MIRATIASTCAMLFCTAALAQQETSATATFVDPKGKEIGTAQLTQTDKGVRIQAEVRGISPGSHAFHVHETGKCDPETGFKSAGGHFNPTNAKHGSMESGTAHAGDMPNQKVGDDGVFKASIVNPNVTLASGDKSIFDSDGSALVIHAGTDDYKSQPAGDAGDRVACAVIERK